MARSSLPRFPSAPSRATRAGLAAAMLAWAGAAEAQSFRNAPRPRATVPAQPLTATEPVTFTADAVEYDRDNATVSASGNVEAWQNDNVLRADRITFDRNTNVAAASGNVVMVQPDGQVLFADYAELTEGLRDGVLRGMRALLAENGRLVANGARRTDGRINELSRVLYTTCNLCAADPTKPPLWQIRARSAVQDGENKRVEYRDAAVDFLGVPVAWFPYIWHADPSVRRASGFLVPSFGQTKQLGTFLTVPYYWAIDEVSDATFAPTFNTLQYFNLNTQYRRRFNDGTLDIDAGIGSHRSGIGADIFASGRFNYDETWRYGFDVRRASSAQYLRDYRVSGQSDVLSSRVFLEGFGTGAYTKLDSIAYQALVGSVRQSRLPYVLPRYQYSYFGEPDRLGGRLSFDTQNFNVLRSEGTNTQRAGARIEWQRPFTGRFGEVYGLTLRADTAGYIASSLNQNPNYSPAGQAETVRAQPTAALQVSWPLVRATSGGGTQLIEPTIQVVAGPTTGGNTRRNRVPNEDSLDFEFTDQNLFALNKFPGLDRQEGGLRANVGLHLNWTQGGAMVDGLVGQSFRTKADDTFPVGSGLEKRASDIVARATVSPAPWLDFTGRTRLDNKNRNVRFADAIGSVGTPALRVNAGYLYSATNPYFLYDTPTIPASYFRHRNEVSLGASTQFLTNYKASAFVRRDLDTSKLVSAGVRGAYEDECFIFDVNLSRRYTSLNGDNGATYLLFQVTLKTVGQVGFNAN